MSQHFRLLVLSLSLPVLIHASASAQSPRELPPANTAVFETLDLPPPNAFRAASGEAGEQYWQQRADYRIQVRLEPGAHRITGSEVITYTNNSPHTLERLWLQLDQNLFQPGSRGSMIQPPDSRWRGAFEGGGFEISNLATLQNGQRALPEYLIDDTRMRVDLPAPLRSGESVSIELDFAFAIPEYGADRMGRLDVERGTVYELAQWYPRMYVFDDVNGWNTLPYLGQGEFHLNYGDFEVDVTAPREYVVVGTGVLRNPEDVLTETQRERLDVASSSDTTVMIIDRVEVGQPGSRPDGSGELTWHFRADNVRDFAWAASDAFIWDASAWEDILMMSVYPHEGLGSPDMPGWERSTEYVRHSIRHYSEMWYHYPYPVAINVAGVVGGMEYPMVSFCSVRSRGQGLFGVTDHEVGHNWFPMIVGSDERRHAWMDEGLNTFMNYYSAADFYGADARRNERVSPDYVARMMQDEFSDQAIHTYADLIRRGGLGFLAYRKPGAGLMLLREYVLGPDRFDPAFRAFIERWAFKNPQPTDFFRTIEDVSGEELDWFWRGWFFSTSLLDQAITSVEITDHAFVTLSHQDDLVMPVELQVIFEDGETERRRIPVEAFTTASTFTVAFDRTDVQEVRIDPDQQLPDVDRTNNSWSINGGTR